MLAQRSSPSHSLSTEEREAYINVSRNYFIGKIGIVGDSTNSIVSNNIIIIDKIGTV